MEVIVKTSFLCSVFSVSLMLFMGFSATTKDLNAATAGGAAVAAGPSFIKATTIGVANCLVVLAKILQIMLNPKTIGERLWTVKFNLIFDFYVAELIVKKIFDINILRWLLENVVVNGLWVICSFVHENWHYIILSLIIVGLGITETRAVATCFLSHLCGINECLDESIKTLTTASDAALKKGTNLFLANNPDAAASWGILCGNRLFTQPCLLK